MHTGLKKYIFKLSILVNKAWPQYTRNVSNASNYRKEHNNY